MPPVQVPVTTPVQDLPMQREIAMGAIIRARQPVKGNAGTNVLTLVTRLAGDTARVAAAPANLLVREDAADALTIALEVAIKVVRMPAKDRVEGIALIVAWGPVALPVISPVLL